jgi:hypothetical protein
LIPLFEKEKRLPEDVYDHCEEGDHVEVDITAEKIWCGSRGEH